MTNKYKKEIDALVKDIDAREKRIRQAQLDGRWYEFASAVLSLSWVVMAGVTLYAVSGAWRDQQ